MWSREYNHSKVASLGSSLLVRAKLFLNTPDIDASKKLGSAFLRGLHNRHNKEWLGRFSVDITSIRFAANLEDEIPEIPATQTPSTTTEYVQQLHTVQVKIPRPTPHLNVGWGEWGPWSKCSPCSPQYDQIRTRQCRLDGGRGVLINKFEPCLPSGLEGRLQGTPEDMETRPCQCPGHGHIHNHHHRQGSNHGVTTTTTTTPDPQNILHIDEEEEFREIEEAG